MRRLAAVVFSMLILITLLLGRSLLERKTESPEQSQSSFSCSTYDIHGNLLKSYWSEKDQVWYLFVTSAQPISETVLHYTGSVCGVSSGVLSMEDGTVTGAFSQSGDRLELHLADGNVQRVIILQSELPSVHIRLGRTTLETLHQDKNIKYECNSIYLVDPGEEHNLIVEGTVRIKGRGNSTWNLYDKKAYQLMFAEETSVMGMGKAKKWVLMANASDDSMIRTKLTYDMAEKLEMGFVPDMEFVDLWIDGEYRGLFTIGEKIELGTSRLNLVHDSGALFEYDDLFYKEEDQWFRSEAMGGHFTLKEIVAESGQNIATAMDTFQNAVETLMNYLYATPSQQITLEDLSAMIDVDSFAKYYLLNEYVLNNDSIVTSFYWYQDGPEDVIHLGPIWDYDTCMGNNGWAYNSFVVKDHAMFRYLLAAPVFRGRVQQLLGEYGPHFAALPENARQLKSAIDTSADMNYKRWDVLGTPNPRDGHVFYPTYAEAVDALCSWLEGRQMTFSVPEIMVVNGAVSEEKSALALSFTDAGAYDSLRFAVWNMESEEQKVFWYDAVRDESGSWTAQVDLAQHVSAGIYRIDAYADDFDVPVSFGFSYVAHTREPLYRMQAKAVDGKEKMKITMQDSGRCQQAVFAVWSLENGQDDLQWYTAKREEKGSWECTVSLEQHPGNGTYAVHAYSQADEDFVFVDYWNVDLTQQTEWILFTVVKTVAAMFLPLIVCWFAIKYRRFLRR